MALLMDRTAARWEYAFRQAAMRAFAEQRDALLSLIVVKQPPEKAAPDNLAPGPQWEQIDQNSTAYMNTEGTAAWRRQFRPVLRGLFDAQRQNWGAVFGFQFNVPNPEAIRWYDDYELQFAQAASETTIQGVSRLLQSAQRDGWSMGETRDNLRKLFRQWMRGDQKREDFTWLNERLPAHRAMLIARTETMRASNGGSFRLFRDMGAGRKEWYSALDHRVRDTHRRAHQQVRPMDSPFMVGYSRMQHPGDMSLGAPIREVANCRCVVLPVLDDDDPEPNDDALPPLDDEDDEEAYEEAIDTAIQEVYELPYERLIVINDRGERILTKDGLANQVQITEAEFNRIKGINATMIHNHPNGWGFPEGHPERAGHAFSREDIAVAAEAGLAETVVVSPGWVYQMRPPEGGWDLEWWEKIGKLEYDVIDRQVYREVMENIRRRRETVPEANARYYHEIWQRWARVVRAIYGRGADYDANLGLVVEPPGV